MIKSGSRHLSKYFYPNSITAVRLMCAPLLFVFLIGNQKLLSIILFGILILTDALDGFVARLTQAESAIGEFFDSTADFFIVLFAFFAFVILEIYPWWIILLIGLMFLIYIFTSGVSKPVYDPIGRYYGGFLFVVIGITLLWTNPIIHFILLILVLLYSVLVIGCRWRMFIINNFHPIKNQ